MSLIISPARWEQVKSIVVLILTKLNLVYNMAVTVFLCVGIKAGAFLSKLFWQNLIKLYI